MKNKNKIEKKNYYYKKTDYTKIELFALLQIVRILSQMYFYNKGDLRHLKTGFEMLSIPDNRILRKFEIFQKSLERELREIVRQVGKEKLEDYHIFLPRL